MGKQHDTFPGEQPEMPQKRNNPEIEEPTDPKEPEIPVEDTDQLPVELPEKEQPEK